MIKKLILHCSASNWGDVEEIRKWHKARGWRDIGYHYVIQNRYHTYADWRLRNEKWEGGLAGIVQTGRAENVQGAHVKNHNENTLGICLIGYKYFDKEQFYSLIILCADLCKKYGLRISDIKGHYEYDKNKTCPNFNMDSFRNLMKISVSEMQTKSITTPDDIYDLIAGYFQYKLWSETYQEYAEKENDYA